MAIIGKVEPISITSEMQRSYLDYAMSVIVARALPDVRDGLKPVQRRIIYAMHQQGIHHTSRYQKSAAVVGEVLKNYHPHGDVAVYDALVRMAQDFSLRYPLIDGQGNFGCFTRDTKVKLTDGRSLSFEELIKEQETGKRHWGFSFNTKTQGIEITEIKKPRLTLRKAELVEVQLDNGEKIKCTPDHRFMLRGGSYKEAQLLMPGDSLMPLYMQTYDGSNDKNLKDYYQLFQPQTEKWEFVHHLAKKLWEDDKIKVLHSQKAKKQWESKKFREKIKKSVSLRNKERLKQNPNFMKELATKAQISLKNKWRDQNYKTKVIKSKILSYTSSLVQKYSDVTPIIYEEERTNNGVPKIDTALEYFQDFSDLTKQSQVYNHKVLQVIRLDIQEDVYDITVDPWHNFALAAGIFVHNSVDGDSQAAMRYTETRLSAIADELLRDINKETVIFLDNYSGTTTEPTLLPSLIPNLLLNGASGIAVGMATQIPPHNLVEVIDALTYIIEHPEKNGLAQELFRSTATVEDLTRFIKGPDFPTGASIYDSSEILAAYATGKGRIVMRARAEIEETKGGRFDIIVTELPFQVNKATLIARIADLVKDKKIEGVADLRDESDRRGMRVVVELKRDGKPQSVLNNLYKYTAMQSVFNVNMVALSDGVPHLMTLNRILEEFIHHRQMIVTRRSQFELKEARAREHILEGLKIAVDHIDAVIDTIKKSKDGDDAKINLVKKFKLTEIQAVAILDMQLRRLAALERQKIEDELKMARELITYLEDLLDHPEKILKVIKDELIKIKERYGDERKTRVYKQKVGEFSEEDLVADEVTIVTVTEGGYIKRQSPHSFRTQGRGGKGVSGITTKEEDAVSHIFYTKTLDNLLFFTDKGRVFQIKVWEIPETSRIAKGQSIVNLINIEQGEKITAILTTRAKTDTKFFLMGTKNGSVKKTPIEEYTNIRKNGLISIKLDGGDLLCWVTPTTGKSDVILVTKAGQSIRFSETQVKATHRDTSGVRGIRLKKGDGVVSMNLVEDPKAQLLTVMENGLGKKTPVAMWKKQSRGGSGIKAAQVSKKTGQIVTAQIINKGVDILVMTSNKGQLIKLNIKDVPTLQRQTQGVILMRVRAGEVVAAATAVSSRERSNE